jgi:hypothetical protein
MFSRWYKRRNRKVLNEARVACTRCPRIAFLPIVNNRADLTPVFGWEFTMETGWVCTNHKGE